MASAELRIFLCHIHLSPSSAPLWAKASPTDFKEKKNVFVQGGSTGLARLWKTQAILGNPLELKSGGAKLKTQGNQWEGSKWQWALDQAPSLEGAPFRDCQVLSNLAQT